MSKFIFVASLILFSCTTYAQVSLEKMDTTLSVFWDPTLKVRLHILDPDEPDARKNNAVLTLFRTDKVNERILFRDSIFAYILLFRITDMDGDGIKDLLIYNMNNGPENKSYHLYLVDQKNGSLKRVKKFERVFNPYFDQGQCLILGYEGFENKLNLYHYQIDKTGVLSATTWR